MYTEISSLPCVKEGDILVNDCVVEILSQLHCDSLTQQIENEPSDKYEN